MRGDSAGTLEWAVHLLILNHRPFILIFEGYFQLFLVYLEK
jgi:hypothetical protein